MRICEFELVSSFHIELERKLRPEVTTLRVAEPGLEPRDPPSGFIEFCSVTTNAEF